ncbi:hypothetical protein [Pantoea sp. 18069]|uniref:hypothetical protein n=1 Tax=Pantoea sp. 18069 TaxID=2681415 RepID=UPI00135A7B8E|nr:hypothetical protein [Pantoea sp. 18069]
MTAFPISRSVAPALAALALSLSLAQSARADYLWLQRDGAQARVFAGELPRPLAQLPALRDAKPVAPEGKPLAVETAANHFAFTPAEQGDARFTATRADAEGVLTYFQARLGRTETKAVNDLELVPTVAGGNTFQLVFKGRPVAASQVNVDTSEGWRRVLAPASDGTVSFEPSFPGLYVLEVSARVDNGSVTIDGKKYSDVRHTATLSFEVVR